MGDDSFARDALDWLRSVGVQLDGWQEDVLLASLLKRDDGRWAAAEVGVVLPRQNGKDAILEARELVGLYLLDERLITHSAHQVDTSLEHFRRLLDVIEGDSSLEGAVKKVTNTNGREGIELKNGCRIRFRSRSKGGGRGFSGDTMILNEAMFLAEFAFGALLPTLSAMPNPQVWYTASPVDQEIHENGIVLARVRERGVAGDGDRLAYFEWSADDGDGGPSSLGEDELSDPGVWAAANPAFPHRISAEAIEMELAAMDNRTFAVERLGVGDWPRTDGQLDAVISPADWMALVDEHSEPTGAVCVAFDVSPDRRAAVAVAGWRSDGRLHVEIPEARQGTAWVAEYLAGVVDRNDVAVVVCDGFGPAASLVNACDDAGVKVETTNAGEMAQACGQLEDLVNEKGLRHLGSDELSQALRGARKRPLQDAWAWSRKNSTVDISPLVAATLALSAAAATNPVFEVGVW